MRNTVKQPRRLSAYLFFFLLEGESVHNVDMEKVLLEQGRVLFVQPNQIHQSVSDWKDARKWYKIAFEESCMTFLPRTYDFLLNPLHNPVVVLGMEEQRRLIHIFEAMADILAQGRPLSADLVLAHLNVLLTELNESYFRQAREKRGKPNGALDTYLAFRRLVESDFRLPLSVQEACKALSVSENKLYAVVRQFSGLSPKAYLLNRTLLEAQRMFYYDRLPVKEVAYELGFSDPDHFSRLFSRRVGKTVTQFLKDVQDLYGK
ncbi:MAG TPA: AraC family transcriptional regulator [Cyclobacteriaceae bacterium]|nr:AraC family transcriptional regulator [Cyclobacteriaceae bacterium]